LDHHRLLLFICTGNYYRSRYAELYFNAHAAQAEGWIAQSRGFRPDPRNIGPIAPCVLKRLVATELPIPPAIRFPIQLREHDFARAERVIALDEAEHQVAIERFYPQWAERMTYWHIPDVDRMRSAEALLGIEREVARLLRGLRMNRVQS
jgi:protein-tyrosine phosphatase